MIRFLHIVFTVLIGVAYLLLFALTWIGMYPEDSFAEVIGRASFITPLVAITSPFVVFVLFLLGMTQGASG